MTTLQHQGKPVATIDKTQRELVVEISTGKKPLDLGPLAKTALTSIVIRGARDGDLPEVKLAAAMPGLRELRVSGTITNWKVLAAYTGLEVLDGGAFTRVDKTDWIAKLGKLRDLDIDVADSKSIDAIADLPALERLKLRGWAFDAAALARAKKLKHLALCIDKATKGLAALSALTGLETLAIEESSIKDLAICEGMTKLRELTIIGGCADAKGIAKLTALEKLRLDRTSIKDLKPLAKLTKLHTLWLRFSRNRLDLSPIASLVDLRELNLYEMRGGIKSLAPLAKLVKLEDLDFSLTEVHDGDFTPLHKLKNLKSLDGDVDTPAQLAALRKALPKCRPMYVGVEEEGDTEEVGSVVVNLPESKGGEYVIFQDLVDDLGVGDQDDVETKVQAAMKKTAPKLAKAISYDSEGSAFGASSTSKEAIMTLAKVIDELITSSSS